MSAARTAVSLRDWPSDMAIHWFHEASFRGVGMKLPHWARPVWGEGAVSLTESKDYGYWPAESATW
jgi:hypothetical protein